MTRAANGTLVADYNKWPNGITVVAAEIHSMGLKMGLSLQAVIADPKH